MEPRAYTCPVIGDGTEENPYRPKVADMGVGWRSTILTDADGIPTQKRCAVEVTTEDHAALLADPDVEAL